MGYNGYGNGREPKKSTRMHYYLITTHLHEYNTDTPIHKLFFKNMINISCFLREIYVLMLRNMRGYMMCLFIFSQIL